MLNDCTEGMLKAASELTAEDLDALQTTLVVGNSPHVLAPARCVAAVALENPERTPEVSPRSDGSRGNRERSRTRESKVSTVCVGTERQRHEWWGVGTDLAGRLGSEVFTATVVENSQVKSGRSLLITSGPSNGQVCLTPTRAAIEATEAFRQTHGLGRAGVSNGWEFWKPTDVPQTV